MKSGKQVSRALMTTTALMAFAVTPPAFAADQAGTSAKQASDNSADAEIVVTGERANRFGTDSVQSGSFRNAKVLDVPMTVSVIPDAVLKSQQAIDLIDAVRNTAGVSTTGAGTAAYNNLTIRGIAVDTRSSYKMDGALNILSSAAFPLEDKDRVEVLKGASAIYYGFSPPSGIVNFVMKRATPNLSVNVRGFGDSNGGLGGQIDVGDTIGDGVFGYRINALATHVDTGIDQASGQRYMLAGTFDVKPTDKLTILADAEWFKKSLVEPAQFSIQNGATALPNLNYLKPSKNIGNLDWDNNAIEEYNALLKGVYKFNHDWDATVYWGRSHLTRLRYNPSFVPGRGTTPSATPTIASYLAAIDPSSATFGEGVIRFGATQQAATYKNTSEAAELHGKITTGPISNTILVGVSRNLRTLAGSPATPRTTIFSNFINPIAVADPHVGQGVKPVASTVDDKGVYVFDDLAYKDIVHLSGGVRRSDYSNDGSTNLSTKQPYHVKPTSYSAGATVKPMKWVSIYGTYIEGLEENSIGSNNVDNANTVFQPISSRLYEQGIKLQPHDSLLIQLAHFDIRREGAYNERNLPGTTILHGFGDATQTYKGYEGSIGGYITKDLAINAAVTFLKARTFQATNAASLHTTPAGTPKRTWSLSGEYALSWLNPNLKVSAGAYYTSKQPLDDTNHVFTPSYTTFDLGASYDFEIGSHRLTARINGQNITNKRYWGAVGSGAVSESLPGLVKFSLSMQY